MCPIHQELKSPKPPLPFFGFLDGGALDEYDDDVADDDDEGKADVSLPNFDALADIRAADEDDDASSD